MVDAEYYSLQAMSQRLLPCPFCGSDAHLAWYKDNGEHVVVECENVSCLSAVYGAETVEEAIICWNRRKRVVMLKLCPFCGSSAELKYYFDNEKYMVKCGNEKCGAETITSSKAEDVIAIWNKRDDEEGDSE